MSGNCHSIQLHKICEEKKPHCDLQEWLPAGHLVYFLGYTVDSLDLGAFHARYAAMQAKLQRDKGKVHYRKRK